MTPRPPTSTVQTCSDWTRKWFQFVSSRRSRRTAADSHCETSSYRYTRKRRRKKRKRWRRRERRRGRYRYDVSDKQEVSSREDVLLILLFFTLPLDDLNLRWRSVTCIQLLLLLSTENHLSVTSALFQATLFHSVNERHNKATENIEQNRQQLQNKSFSKLQELPLNTFNIIHFGTQRTQHTLSPPLSVCVYVLNRIYMLAAGNHGNPR